MALSLKDLKKKKEVKKNIEQIEKISPKKKKLRPWESSSHFDRQAGTHRAHEAIINAQKRINNFSQAINRSNLIQRSGTFIQDIKNKKINNRADGVTIEELYNEFQLYRNRPRGLLSLIIYILYN